MDGEVKQCQGKDVFERMNYLYQMSHTVAKTNIVMASYYSSTMISCAKKAVLRMEPDVKRTLCKTCKSPLVPGETARVRLISKPIKAVKWTCLSCGSSRKIPTKNGYKIWWDQPEATRCVLDYTPKSRTRPILEKTVRTEERDVEKNKEQVDKVA